MINFDLEPSFFPWGLKRERGLCLEQTASNFQAWINHLQHSIPPAWQFPPAILRTTFLFGCSEKTHSVYLIDPVYPAIPKYSKSLNLSWIMITGLPLLTEASPLSPWGPLHPCTALKLCWAIPIPVNSLATPSSEMQCGCAIYSLTPSSCKVYIPDGKQCSNSCEYHFLFSTSLPTFQPPNLAKYQTGHLCWEALLGVVEFSKRLLVNALTAMLD